MPLGIQLVLARSEDLHEGSISGGIGGKFLSYLEAPNKKRNSFPYGVLPPANRSVYKEVFNVSAFFCMEYMIVFKANFVIAK